MIIAIDPYTHVNSLKFGDSTSVECQEIFGVPQSLAKTRRGFNEFHYPECVLRFDREDKFDECTLLPYTESTVAGIPITWDKQFLQAASKVDKAPQETVGFIVFLKLGIFASGIHDDDHPQLAVTAFRRGDLDKYLEDAVPYMPEQLPLE